MNVYKLILCFTASFLFFVAIHSRAQPVSAPGGVRNILDALAGMSQNLPAEKIYLQLDKTWYAGGDTVWFKAYVFKQTDLTASPKSGLLYVEIVNDSNLVAKRVMLPLYAGTGRANIAIDKNLTAGNYTLRAYTNWIRNFGEDYIARARFQVSGTDENKWLVDARMRSENKATKDSASLALRLRTLTNLPVGLREIQLQVSSGKRSWYKQNLETNADGMVQLSLPLRDKITGKPLWLQVDDRRKGADKQKLVFPLTVENAEDIDLQFMPEGGHLLGNIATTVGFKAVGEDGRGRDLAGKILNSRKEEVAEFSSLHKGIGSFMLTPVPGEIYTAQVTLADGSGKTYLLPAVKNIGSSLQIVNAPNSDSLQVNIRFTKDLAAKPANFYLVGQSRGVPCFGASFNSGPGRVTIRISKAAFPTGITRFTLLTDAKIPVNERMVFINHQDNLRIHIPMQKQYANRDSIGMHIAVTDFKGAPVSGTFSLAVTDDTQVRRDSVSENNIFSTIHLTSDLKGTVEDPGYYVGQSTNAQIATALDNLLLTQGWVGYSWQQVFAALAQPAFWPEPEFAVKGRVTNMLNKPVAGTGVVLIAKKPSLLRDTVTNQSGMFTFKNIMPSDSSSFFIQARNQKGKSFNVGIEVDEFKAPVFSAATQPVIPWYVNTDGTQLSFITQNRSKKLDQARLNGSILLKEVAITGKKIIKNSKNLNGPGGADLVLDEEEMIKAGHKTLGDLLKERIKGFKVSTNKKGHSFYTVDNMLLHLIIDGMDIDFSYMEGTDRKIYFDTYLDYYTAEDITGIEVMRSPRYQMSYKSEFLPPLAIPWEHCFIEISTRSGHGPYMKKTSGTFVYRPLPAAIPAQFYSPRYTVKSNTATQTDRRSTLFWAPDIITDNAGKATVWFFAADLPGSYTILLEGSDMNGNLGTYRHTLIITKRAP